MKGSGCKACRQTGYRGRLGIFELLTVDDALLQCLTVRECPGKFCFRYWQEGPGFDRNIFSFAALAASIDYIHNNPVSRGLCAMATDWSWSSARFYLLDPLRKQFRDWPQIQGWGSDLVFGVQP